MSYLIRVGGEIFNVTDSLEAHHAMIARLNGHGHQYTEETHGVPISG